MLIRGIKFSSYVIILYFQDQFTTKPGKNMNRNNVFNRPMSWIIFVLLAAGGVFYVARNFEKANSLINVDIQMDRNSALEKAARLSREYNIGPKEFEQAAAFRNDSRFQYFVELEAGGLDTFTSIVADGYYYSYHWSVRHFKEQDANEVVFWFKPNGETYGFNEKIPESEKGAALSEDEALKLAEHHAIYNWDVDLEPYKLVEKSKEEQISGRIDYTFVYERTDKTIGEGKFRLTLVVSGDKLTAVDYSVKIPEDFDRRYSEMRSANDTIQMISIGAMAIIYGLLGVILGIFFLMRSRRLIWKPAVYWGMGITFASVFLVTINHLPFVWFSYDTSLSQSNFLLRQLLSGLLGAAGFGAILALSFMAAEGLGRIAFPEHIQWWKIWSKEVGGSRNVLGQTIAGYLFAIIILAFDVFFYLTTTTHFGWWSPAGTLSDPNILATYLPWLDSIATSLQAGFWEESLFRAVPIAGIVLLTKGKKSRNFWIILVLILQTLIFGAGHASYAQQPSYARVLEMIVPFTIMGIIYIYYGILPGVIAHYSVDVFWISLPLWVSSTSGIWIDRALVLLFLFIPLIIVFFFRFRTKKWTQILDQVRNKGWEVPEKIEVAEKDEPVAEIKKLNVEKWMLVFGVAGLLAWLLFSPFKSDSPVLAESKKDAIEIAKKELVNRYNLNLDDWTILTSVSSDVDIRDIFVWRESDEKTYQQMLNSWLAPPYWNIRLVKTKGKAEEKTEEYIVEIRNNGDILGVIHKIPEKLTGSNLEKPEAQQIADSVLTSVYNLQRTNLKEISVSPEKQENRTDWEFIYADTTAFPLSQGQGRYLIDISGNEVTQTYSFVHVPEEWMRNYKEEKSKITIIKTISNILVIGSILFGLVLGIIRWTRKKFNVKIMLYITGMFALFYVLEVVTTWPTMMANYSTQLPMGNFITTMLIGLAISGIFLSLFNGIFLGATPGWLPVMEKPAKNNFWMAVAFGLFTTGVLVLVKVFMPKTEPLWIDFSYLNGSIPWIALTFSKTASIIFYPAFAIILFMGMHYFTKGWSAKKWIGIGLSLLGGLAIMGLSFETATSWLVSGLILSLFIGAVYYFFIRFHFEWIPVGIGLIPVFSMMKQIIIVGSGTVIVGGVLMILISVAILYWWYLQLIKYSVQKR